MNNIVLDPPNMFASRKPTMDPKDKEVVKSGLALRPKSSNNEQDSARNSTLASDRFEETYVISRERRIPDRAVYEERSAGEIDMGSLAQQVAANAYSDTSSDIGAQQQQFQTSGRSERTSSSSRSERPSQRMDTSSRSEIPQQYTETGFDSSSRSEIPLEISSRSEIPRQNTDSRLSSRSEIPLETSSRSEMPQQYTASSSRTDEEARVEEGSDQSDPMEYDETHSNGARDQPRETVEQVSKRSEPPLARFGSNSMSDVEISMYLREEAGISQTPPAPASSKSSRGSKTESRRSSVSRPLSDGLGSGASSVIDVGSQKSESDYGIDDAASVLRNVRSDSDLQTKEVINQEVQEAYLAEDIHSNAAIVDAGNHFDENEARSNELVKDQDDRHSIVSNTENIHDQFPPVEHSPPRDDRDSIPQGRDSFIKEETRNDPSYTPEIEPSMGSRSSLGISNLSGDSMEELIRNAGLSSDSFAPASLEISAVDMSETPTKVIEESSISDFHLSEPSLTQLDVSIKRLVLDMDNEIVSRKFDEIQQIFLAYTFLDISPDELESPSVPVSQAGIHIFDFTKSTSILILTLLAFDIDSERAEMISRMLRSSNPVDSVIVFNLVSEPHSDNPDGECQDIAIAELHLTDLISDDTDVQLLKIPVWDVEGESVMGNLEVLVRGCGVLKRHS
jgi:hypothetical protein